MCNQLKQKALRLAIKATDASCYNIVVIYPSIVAYGMSLLTGSHLTKYYGADEVFHDVSVEVPHRARIALVGANGAGKTTLLNILMGADVPNEGVVSVAANAQMGFLPQRPELAGNHTLWEEQLRAFEQLRATEDKLARLEHAMADPQQYGAALAEYGRLQERFELAGGYTYESRMKIVLQGVGFTPRDYDTPLARLSGGQKTRALLARLLLNEPEILILDEPTNHLDIEAVEWLENFLRDFPGAVVAVSHDRYFMDAFATTIWELEYGNLEVYRGNYSHYVQQRDERHERLQKEYESQQAFVEKEQAYIRKHMGSRWTAQAKGRLKKLETMKKRGKIIAKPRGERKDMNLRLSASIRSGDKVLITENLAIGYADDRQTLFNTPDITLYRGETAALIGPNGVGKSTFLKTIIGQIEPLSGTAEIGASVKVGYFAQAHERLNPQNTLIDEVNIVKQMPVSEARHYLARFLFTGDDTFRTVETLSGGERGRLALAKLVLDGANLLLLDEPTNHLDIDSQEVLEAALSQFDGTILLVSHDRYLIDALATQIWSAQPGEMVVFKGTYREYIAERNKKADTTVVTESSTVSKREENFTNHATVSNKHGLNPFQLKKRLAEVEQEIHEVEGRLDALTQAIAEASLSGDAEKVHELGEDYNRTAAELQSIMEQWEILAG
jgi:ATP-binding cassette subfamily F protein 3